MHYIETGQNRGGNVAIATLARAWGSGPHGVESRLVVNNKGEMFGSVSGGCGESAMSQEARRVLKTGCPKLLQFGVAYGLAQTVGLACGGAIEIFVERLGW